MLVQAIQMPLLWKNSSVTRCENFDRVARPAVHRHVAPVDVHSTRRATTSAHAQVVDTECIPLRNDVYYTMLTNMDCMRPPQSRVDPSPTWPRTSISSKLEKSTPCIVDWDPRRMKRRWQETKSWHGLTPLVSKLTSATPSYMQQKRACMPMYAPRCRHVC